jgi:uncharacterized protein YbcC (UPF0753/DUF2309 family)
MKKEPNLTLGILITTCNENIKKVKKSLLPKLIKNKGVDEIIISHQIFDNKTKFEKTLTKGKIKYFHMFKKGVSKNRNNCIKNSKSDICYTCDDDIKPLKNFSKIINEEYKKNQSFDILTFQAENEKKENYFNLKERIHNKFSILKIWTLGITFRRKVILKNKLFFDEDFGFSKYPTGEETIFLKDCFDKKLKMKHINKKIVFHKNESTGDIYNDKIIISRPIIFKRMFGIFGGIFAVFYFTIFKYKFYKNKYSFFKYFWLSLKGFFEK